MAASSFLEVSPAGEAPYNTINAALDALIEVAPDETQPATIHLNPGTYHERVEIKRPNLTLEGEVADQVTITMSYGANDQMPDGSKRGTFRTFTVFVDADNVTLRNLTIENEAGPGKIAGQALALYADGDRLVVENCQLMGHQDTLFCGPLPPKEVKPGGFIGPKEFAARIVGRQYYRRCLIEGDVDVIFGGACAYFDGCEIRSLSRHEPVNGYVTAPSAPKGEPYGFVFHGCSFTGEGVEPKTVYLARPWRDWGQTVLINCWIGPHVRDDGWCDWNKPHARECCLFAGYDLTGPGSDTSSWASFAKVLTPEQASRYTRQQVLAGNDGWDPLGGAEEATETESLSDNGRTLHIGQYYEDEASMHKRFAEQARQDAFTGTTKQEFEDWQQAARTKLADLLGTRKLTKAALQVKKLSHTELSGGIVRTKVLLQVEQDVWMPAYLLQPKHPRTAPDGKMECFICPNGHQGAGAASVAGIMGVPAVDSAIRIFNYDYGLRLARMGYFVVCPEARGWGERRDCRGQGDDEREFLQGTCLNQARMAEPLGLSVLGLLSWDLMRLVDYLLSRGDISEQTLGCFGFSGGGMQTLYFTALDERIKKVFISGYFYGVKDSLLHLNGNCSCNYVPNLWRSFDVGDIAGLIVPRPLMVQSCREDHLNGPRGLKNVEEQLDIVRSLYKLEGAEANVSWEICPGEHHLGIAHLADDVAWLDDRAKQSR